MGCGMSRVNLPDEDPRSGEGGGGGGGYGLHLLRRRIEEMRKNDKKARMMDNASTRLLLRDELESVDGRKSVSSVPSERPSLHQPTLKDFPNNSNNKNRPPTMPMQVSISIMNDSSMYKQHSSVEPAPEAVRSLNNNNNAVGAMAAHYSSDARGGVETPPRKSVGVVVKDERELKTITQKQEEAIGWDIKRCHNHDEEEELEDDPSRISETRLSEFDGSTYIGSPSFREYCYNEWDDVSEDGLKYEGNNDEDHHQVQENGMEPRENIECLNENGNQQESMARQDQKRRGRRPFRKVFPMHRPAGVKNLLNVTTCINPDSAHRHDQAGKPPERAY